jgi:putative tryptophan/tyrosine transport system substrate-binding protein
MRRREFMALSLGAASMAFAERHGRGEEFARLKRLGIILDGNRTPSIEGLVQGMHELGHVEGKDYLADWRFADGRYVRFPAFAQDFVRLKIDAIFVATAAAVAAVQGVTRSIPIVMGYSVDPVGNHLVARLDRPGGNVTGMASSGETPWPKQIELIEAVLPDLARIGILLNPEGSDYSDVQSSILAVAEKRGLSPVWADARRPADLIRAFEMFARQGVTAAIVTDDPYFFAQQEKIAELALAHRVAAICGQREFVQAGALMSYGESLKESYRRAASFVDRIFKGGKAGELPIEAVPRRLVISRRTATSLGIMIPPAVWAIADETID